jgi:hypothetical protein
MSFLEGRRMTTWGNRGWLGAALLLAACRPFHYSAKHAPDPIEPGDGTSENTASRDAIDFDASNPFFRDGGTNGRVCGTCHHEEQGWTTTPAFARKLADGDPLFVFDGSDCLPAGVPNPSAVENSSEMLLFGNVRIELSIPAGADYSLADSIDPHGCPVSPSASALRVYRRPLPVANTALLAVVMWDGRESVVSSVPENLARQANSAHRTHARASNDLAAEDRVEVVDFETGLFHARRRIGDLDLASSGGRGGPRFLLEEVAPSFFIGKNSPFASGFTPKVFTLFASWEPGANTAAPTALAASIGRGEAIFNGKPITIRGVGGINGANDASQAPVQGSCSTCHSNPNVGNVSVADFLDIGVTRAGAQGLDVRHLPSYTFRENGSGRTTDLTDPGRGGVTGRFADLGKTKIPSLRGLSLRAPYFHNGSARDFATVVAFYERRFGIAFTAQEREDLVAFLSAL